MNTIICQGKICFLSLFLNRKAERGSEDGGPRASAGAIEPHNGITITFHT